MQGKCLNQRLLQMIWCGIENGGCGGPQFSHSNTGCDQSAYCLSTKKKKNESIPGDLISSFYPFEIDYLYYQYQYTDFFYSTKVKKNKKIKPETLEKLQNDKNLPWLTLKP